jgi:hypothetical protein
MSMLSVVCEHCAKKTEYNASEVIGLDDYVDAQCAEARVDVEMKFEDFIDPEKMFGGDYRRFQDLATAIRCGDRDEAEYQLDLLASDVGFQAEHQVSLGRFARRAAADPAQASLDLSA